MTVNSWDASGPIAVLNDRYSLSAVLDAGGTATVYKAEDRTLSRTVAVKVLHSSHLQFARRFRDASVAAATLNHPNVVTIFDVGSAMPGDSGEAMPCVVMEFVDGTNLRARLSAGGRMSENEAVRLMLQICSGVGYAHKRGMVHGDVRAERVLLTHDGRAKVTGFGASSTQTATDDVRALGALLFEMLHGRAPGTPRAARVTVSAPLMAILKRVRSSDSTQRYRNADQLASALADHLLRSEPAQPSATAPSIAERLQVRQGAASAPRPARAQAAAQTATVASAPTFVETAPRVEEPGGLGFGVILLAILAVLSVLGLIPLYAQVYVAYTRPPQSGSGVYVAPTPSPAAGIVMRTQPPPQVRATSTTAPTIALVELPTDWIGRPLDDALRTWFTQRGLTLVERSAFSTEPEGTILSIEPDAPSVREGGAVTLTMSSGGRAALDVALGDAVVVESARFTRDEYRPGMNAQVEVTWRALRPPGRDYRVFVHLHDVAGNFIAQTGDRAPANRGEPYPTAAWSAGTVVVDTYELPIPLDAAPGVYEIRVGLYDDAGRLPVTRGDAERVKSNGVIVGVVRVQ